MATIRWGVVGALALAGLAACTTTRFTSTWKDPTAQPVTLQGEKVAAFVVSPNEALRRSGEDALARELTARGVQGIPGYQLLAGADATDPAALRGQLKDAGIDGIVVMRVIDRRQEVTYVPGAGPYYGSFYGYWDYGWSAVSDPGYMTTDTIVSVETLVYSVPQDKLLWGGVSETTDPEKLDSFIKELVDKAADEMKKDGLITR